ncbi:MAG: DUF366 family protein [Candidatus Geothermincolia bacterium]
MEFALLKGELCYDGTQLRSGWIREMTGYAGDAALAFFGPAHVTVENLVDLEDRAAGAEIHSQRMLHLLVERRDAALYPAVLLQRLVICSVREALEEVAGVRLEREGDDLYWYPPQGERRKLTVSIATSSEVSSLIHVGINVTGEGAPVPAIGLDELGAGAVETFAAGLLERLRREMSEVEHATTKVRQVP